jgi:methylenetetrahydrofolate dehydrogenase (NADP+)/methenyltetrahydrofolate cyclohydrolase
MTARIIDGKAVARKLRTEYAVRVERLKAEHGIQPGIAVILVGDNAASQVYVRNKIKACKETGIHSELCQMPADTPESELLARIDQLNSDPAVHGILVQLPLPSHIDVAQVLERIDVDKDVDGFHLYNVGGLVTGNTVFPPCTPFGVQKLLEHENVKIEGQNADGADAYAAGRHRLHLPQEDARPGPVHAAGRYPGRCCRCARVDRAADGEDRRGGDRRRHQPATGRPACR